MDAAALIGRQTGTCVLQRVIGNGTLGAVYLGQQTQPARPVAVKVFLRLASLEVQQQRAFLAIFRDEMARVFALQHPNILPVFDYGDMDGLAYIVTPYVLGETLEDVLVREGTLPLQVAADCLQQIAAALEYAHKQGVVHRDLKPANIFLTPEKKVLVADFHLTSLLVEGKTAQMRLSKPGLLDYMSPELIIGKHIDKRTDLYSLGALLYRMVTGNPLFQGQTLMKVATKHLKMPPPSPRAARPDLPPAAEQVIFKALVKDPRERFDNALDVSRLFQQAINNPTATHPAFQPISPLPPVGTRFIASGNSSPGNLMPAHNAAPVDVAYANPASVDTSSIETGPRPFAPPLTFRASSPANSASSMRVDQHDASTSEINLPSRITWALPEIMQDDSGTTGTYKLTGPARVVNIPVAGQPGRYVTGILPSSQEPTKLPALPAPAQTPVKPSKLRRFRVSIFALAALLIVCGSLGFVYLHFSVSKGPGGSTLTNAGTPNAAASATAAAKGSAEANIIFSDTLSHNIRSWPESSNGSFLFQFKDGAYHITNNDSSRVATAILPGENLDQPFVYTLTMDEIRGDDTSLNNESGMILRFNSQVKNGRQNITFYTFEVVNKKGGQYQFWKYDNSQGPSADPWKELAFHPFGSEFHQGQGPANTNTLKILVNGKNFTLIVNGKQVWSVQDSSLASGQVGMLVNLKGTEVAFSNLLLTWR